jgi:hypothetical protein
LNDTEGKHQTVPDTDDVTPEDFGNCVRAEVDLPIGGTMCAGEVKLRPQVRNGKLMLDSRSYKVQFPDGEVGMFSANVVAGTVRAMCDLEGNRYHLIKSSLS